MHKFFWIFLYLTLFVFLIIPFIFLNKLDIWDTSSHLQAIWFVKKYLFPDYTGWNPFAFAGFPQGLLYPPLFHYLGAFLSIFFPIEVSLKILIVVPIIIFPAVIYYFGKTFGLDKTQDRFFLVVFYFVGMIIFGEKIGGSFAATFNNGLVVNNLTLVFSFLLLIFLRRKQMVLSSVFLSLIVLIHLPTAIFAILATCAFVLTENKSRRFYLLILFFSFLFTSFWTVPFLIWRSEMALEYLAGVNLFDTFFLMIFGFIVFVFNRQNFAKLSQSLIIVFLLIFVSWFSLVFHFPKWHVYRLISYVYWLCPFLLFFLLKRFGFENSYKSLAVICIFVFYFFAKAEKPISYFNYGIKIPKIEGNGRIITSNRVPFIPKSPHFLNDQIPIVSGKMPALGLFMEESRNSRYLLWLLHQMSNKNFVWGISPSVFMKNAFSPIDKTRVMNLFNITHILEIVPSTIEISPNSILLGEMPNPTREITEKNNLLILTKVGDDKLVEPISSVEFFNPMKSNWEEHVEKWFFTNPIQTTLIDSKGEKSISSVSSGVRVKNLFLNKNQSTIGFEVESDRNVPILVKIAYFPKWKAYSSGQEIKIFRAAPNLMAINSRGRIIMRYEDQGWEIILRLFSLISFVFFLIMNIIYKIKNI